MEPSELELYTSQQLIDELMRRQSFLGVVVHSLEDPHGRGWRGQQTFQLRVNDNLDLEQAHRLLGEVLERLGPPEG
jgi:hypothetical protein